VLRRVFAFTELKFSNSMIEAWWRLHEHRQPTTELCGHAGVVAAAGDKWIARSPE
jgi:hypothetical protein